MPDFPGTLKTPRLSAAPSSPVAGQMYYNTTDNKLYWWNGTTWVDSSGGGGLPPVVNGQFLKGSGGAAVWSPIDAADIASGTLADARLPGRIRGDVSTQAPGNNLDSITASGWYYYDPNTVARPEANYGYVHAYTWPGVLTMRQTAYSYADQKIWTRVGTGGWSQVWPLPARLAESNAASGYLGDCNTPAANGWYFVNYLAANAPPGGTYWHLFHQHNDAMIKRQIAYDYQSEVAWTRRSDGNAPAGWKAWVQIAPATVGESIVKSGSDIVYVTDGGTDVYFGFTFPTAVRSVVVCSGDANASGRTSIFSVEYVYGGNHAFRLHVRTPGDAGFTGNVRCNWIATGY